MNTRFENDALENSKDYIQTGILKVHNNLIIL